MCQGLIAMDGLKTNREWDALEHEAKVRYLAELDALQLRGQASVRAAAAQASVDQVLMSWMLCGYVDYARVMQARAARPAAEA